MLGQDLDLGNSLLSLQVCILKPPIKTWNIKDISFLSPFFDSQVKEGLAEVQKTLKVGDVQDFSNFMSAVIDKKAFDRISGYIDHAKSSPNTKIVAGGTYDESVGYYIQPTVVETTSKDDRIFKEEIFGPVVTAFVYPDSQAKTIVDHIGKDTPYALTGAIYSQDQ